MKNWNPVERVKIKEKKGVGKAKGTTSYSVEAVLPNKQRFRQRFNSYEEAFNKATDLQTEGTNMLKAMNTNVRPTTLNSDEEAEYQNAIDKLKKHLPNLSLLGAVQFAIDRYDKDEWLETTIKEAVIQYANFKEDEGVGKNYLETYMRYLGAKKLKGSKDWSIIPDSFADSDRLLEDVTADELYKIIYDPKKNLADATKISVHKSYTAFFNWARRCDPPKCSRNVMKSGNVPRPKNNKADPEAFTPAEAKLIMETASEYFDGELVPFFALALFGGLRIEEITGNTDKNGKIPPLMWVKEGRGGGQNFLIWSQVKDKRGKLKDILEVKLTGKKAWRRTPVMPDNCYEWLKKYEKTEGPIIPSNFRKKFDYIRAKAGFRVSKASLTTKRKTRKGDDASYGSLEVEGIQELIKVCDSPNRPEWVKNGCRHSALSYQFKIWNDKDKVCAWAGNTPKVFDQNYNAGVTLADAQEYFDIRPSS